MLPWWKVKLKLHEITHFPNSCKKKTFRLIRQNNSSTFLRYGRIDHFLIFGRNENSTLHCGLCCEETTHQIWQREFLEANFSIAFQFSPAHLHLFNFKQNCTYLISFIELLFKTLYIFWLVHSTIRSVACVGVLLSYEAFVFLHGFNADLATILGRTTHIIL